MTKTLLSSSWYRVAALKARLRPHAVLHRQRFRGQTWYVLQDHHSGRFHRMSPAANLIICLMDGRRSMQEIWELVCRRFPDDPPTQDDTIGLLAQLHASDLLQGELAPDLAELSHRSDQQKQRTLLMKLRNPLALRFPLIDPDRFLEATLPMVRPLFSLVGLLLWLTLVVVGVTLAAMHWQELTSGLTDRVLAADNIALMFLAYPLIKGLHELGHGYATKVWGGEVHEMGIMLLVLMPIPYVDASSSSAFREKWRRAVVGGAGIMVELTLASVAMIFWVGAEPGLARAFAFNIMLIGGVSTVLFNGNPLLRFDGYYILTDLVEIPNLATRSNKYIFYLIQKHLFGKQDSKSPVSAPGERLWFISYGLSAFTYRIFITAAIVTFVSTQFFFIGIVFAIWAVFNMFGLPIFKGIQYLVTSPQLRNHRARAYGVVGAAAVVLLVGLFVVPLPYATVTQGVVTIPERAVVRAKTHGVVAEVLAPSNAAVTAGQALIELKDPIVAARGHILRAQLKELGLRLDAVKLVNRVQADILREQTRHLRAALELNRQRQSDLTIRAEKAGRFIMFAADDLPGRYVRQGDGLGYVIDESDPVLRVLIAQEDVDLIRYRTRNVEVRFPGHLETVNPAVLRHEVPAAVEEIPEMAFTKAGGGEIALDPSKPSGRQALASLFQFDIVVPAPLPTKTIGGHAYVRFDHGHEAIAWRLMRTIRQVFLSVFDV